MSTRFLLLWFSGTVIAAAIARTGLLRERDLSCSFDGVRVETGGRVDLFDGEQRLASFCGPECALAWPGRERAAGESRFVVYEERHGAPLDASVAFFVRSGAHRGGLRAFADPLSAAEYARTVGGVPLSNPLDEDRR